MPVTTGFTDVVVSWDVGTIDPDSDDLPIGALPNINNGTLTALTRRVNQSLEIAMQLKFGSTTDPGGTPWYFTLKFANPRESHPFVLPALAYDKSAARWYTGAAYCGHISAAAENNQLIVAAYFGQSVTGAGATVPFTWATGDRLLIGNALEAFDN